MPARAAAWAPAISPSVCIIRVKPVGAMPNGSSDRRAEDVPAGARPWTRRAGSPGGTRCRGTPAGPARSTVRPRPNRRCSRTPPCGVRRLAMRAQVLDGQRLVEPALRRVELGLLELHQRREVVPAGEPSFHRDRSTRPFRCGARCGLETRCVGKLWRPWRTQFVEVAAQTAPCARACDQHVTDRGRLDRAGDHRYPDPVGDQLAQQPVLRAAADEVDRLAREPRTARRPARRRGRTRRPGSRRSRGPSRAGSPERGSPRSSYHCADPARHVAGGDEPRVVGVEHLGRRRARRRPARAARAGRRGSRRAPTAGPISLSSHRPITLRRNRIRPSAPTSLVKLAARAASVDHRRGQLDADQRPGAAGDVGRRLRVHRDRDDGRGGVVRGDRGDRRSARSSPTRSARSGSTGPSSVPGFDERGEQAGRQAEHRSTVRRPTVRRCRAARWSRRWCARSTSRPVSQ